MNDFMPIIMLVFLSILIPLVADPPANVVLNYLDLSHINEPEKVVLV
jgi:hypothetical protein